MPGPYPSDFRVGTDGPPAFPPPLPYSKPRRRRVLIGGLVALLVIAAMTVGVLQLPHRAPSTPAGAFSDAAATSAIQGYLDALQNRDTDIIARNASCGIYDAVRDHRSDQAVAKLSSDAFRKQFREAKVTSIDKIVYWSNYQAQVLFSMLVQPDGGGGRSEVQGTAQLLSQRNQVLVCSYVLHSAGVY